MQLSPTVKKLCHTKCDDLVNFYISLEKQRQLVISLQQYDQSPQIWHDYAAHVSQMHRLLRIILNIQGGGWPKLLRDPFCIIMGYRDFLIFKIAALRRLGFLRLKFLTSMHFRDMFCMIVQNHVQIGHTVAEILQFSSLHLSGHSSEM